MNVHTFRQTLAAGERVRIARRGRFVRGIAADAPYALRIDDGAPFEFQTGFGAESREFFAGLEIINTDAGPQEISIIVADAPVWDNRLVGQVDISGGIRAAGNRMADYGAATVGTGAVQIAPANSNRAAIMVQNLGTAPIYVGPDASVTTGIGIRVSGGGVATLTLQTAIYAVSASAGQDVRYLEESL